MTDKPKKPTVSKKPNFGARHIDVTDSSLVEKVYYDPETKTLDAVFKKTGRAKDDPAAPSPRYRYKRIPHRTFAELVLAKSMGRYFNAYIKNTYRFEKVA